MSVRDEIAESAGEVLEPNLQFYRRDPSDRSRYTVGPEVLAALAWVATSIALPILLSAANEVVRDRVKEWLRMRQDKKEPALEPPEELSRESDRMLEAKGDIATATEQVTESVAAVSEYLAYRGWPEALATADATQIVEVIRERIGAKR